MDWYVHILKDKNRSSDQEYTSKSSNYLLDGPLANRTKAVERAKSWNDSGGFVSKICSEDEIIDRDQFLLKMKANEILQRNFEK